MISNSLRRTQRLASARRPPAPEPTTPHLHTDAVEPAPAAVATPEPGEQQTLLLTAEQAAPILQVRPSWLRRKAAARAIPCRYVGKHLRFTRADLVAITEQHAAGPRNKS